MLTGGVGTPRYQGRVGTTTSHITNSVVYILELKFVFWFWNIAKAYEIYFGGLAPWYDAEGTAEHIEDLKVDIGNERARTEEVITYHDGQISELERRMLHQFEVTKWIGKEFDVVQKDEKVDEPKAPQGEPTLKGAVDSLFDN